MIRKFWTLVGTKIKCERVETREGIRGAKLLVKLSVCLVRFHIFVCLFFGWLVVLFVDLFLLSLAYMSMYCKW